MMQWLTPRLLPNYQPFAARLYLNPGAANILRNLVYQFLRLNWTYCHDWAAVSSCLKLDTGSSSAASISRPIT